MDKRLREAERQYYSNQTDENLKVLNRARIRANLTPLVYEICEDCGELNLTGPSCSFCGGSTDCVECTAKEGCGKHYTCDQCRGQCLVCGYGPYCPKCDLLICGTCERPCCNDCIMNFPDEEGNLICIICYEALQVPTTPLAQRQNPDEEIRRSQRFASGGDIHQEAGYLRKRIRTGRLDPHHVELAAYLGHSASLLLFPAPTIRPFRFSSPLPEDRPLTKTILVLGHLFDLTTSFDLETKKRWDSRRFQVSVAADFVEHVLPIWEDWNPEDTRPRILIQDARAWVALNVNRHGLSVQPSPAGSSVRESYVGDAASHIVLPPYAARAAANAWHIYDELGDRYAADYPTPEEIWQKQHLIKRLLEDSPLTLSGAGPIRRNLRRFLR